MAGGISVKTVNLWRAIDPQTDYAPSLFRGSVVCHVADAISSRGYFGSTDRELEALFPGISLPSVRVP